MCNIPLDQKVNLFLKNQFCVFPLNKEINVFVYKSHTWSRKDGMEKKTSLS